MKGRKLVYKKLASSTPPTILTRQNTMISLEVIEMQSCKSLVCLIGEEENRTQTIMCKTGPSRAVLADTHGAIVGEVRATKSTGPAAFDLEQSPQ